MKEVSLEGILSEILPWLTSSEFVKLSLGSYDGAEPELKNVYIKPVLIKREEKLSFTYRYQRRDIVKNFDVYAASSLLKAWFDQKDFHAVSLFTQQQQVVFQRNKKGKWFRREEQQKQPLLRIVSHDKQKERSLVDTNQPYLKALRLTDENGNVYKNAQDKWKQINHFITLLRTELEALPQNERITAVDMGAGKGYLTFALYDYLSNVLKRETDIIGIEWREDLVGICNTIAKEAAFDGLRFQQGAIADFVWEERPLHLLMALHACDTATDDAIKKGIVHQAKLIVVAPCCHKQIRRELEKAPVDNDLDFMTQHGIFLERHAEMLTDGIRVLILEYFGYKVKVVEFISDAHTPKNVLLIASYKGMDQKKQKGILKKIKAIKSYFGIGYHYLERAMLEHNTSLFKNAGIYRNVE